MDIIERFIFTMDGQDYCLLIESDQDADNPRDWGHLGHLYCWHNRYNLGDQDNPYDSPQEFLDDIRDIPEEDICMIQVDMLDHSGLSIYASGTHVAYPWDSGQIGWIFATRDDADAEGCPWDSVEERLLADLDIYAKYVGGECYVGTVCELEDGYDENNIEVHILGVRDSCASIYTREDWGIGMAEEVLEVMGYGGYSELRDI